MAPAQITRAADRVAVWHQAADEPFTDPPAPEQPAPQIKIPKSNSFTHPASSLKKLLDKVQPPSAASTPHTHPQVKDWVDKHPKFAQSYLKPQYQQGLKAHLGDDAYAKLLHHMPKEHHDALHGQPGAPAVPQTAPTPAEKVHPPKPLFEQLKAKPTKSTLPHLKPKPPKADDDEISAIKGLQPKAPSHDKNLSDIYNATKAQQLDNPLGHKAWLESLAPDLAAKLAKDPQAAQHDYGQWQQGFPEDDQDEVGAIKGLQEPPAPADDPQQHQALVEGIKKIFPNSSIAQHPNEASVPEIKKQLESWSQHLDHPDHQPAVKALKALYDQHFGGQAPSAQQAPPGQPSNGYDHDAAAEAMHALNPNFMLDKLKASKPEDLKAITESMAKNPGQPGANWQALLDQHFGQGAAQAAAPSPEQPPEPSGPPDLIEDIKRVFPTVDDATVANLQGKSPQEQKKYLEDLVPAYSEGGQWHDEEQLADLKALISKHFEPAQQQTEASAWDPDKKSALMDSLHGLPLPTAFVRGVADTDDPEMAKDLLKAKIDQFQQSGMPGGAQSLQKAYDQHFGQETAGDNTEDVWKDPLFAHSLFASDETDNESAHHDLFNKPAFQKWWLGLPQVDKEYYADHPNQATDEFNSSSQGVAQPEEKPEPLQEQDLLAQPQEPAAGPKGLADDLEEAFPGSYNPDYWNGEFGDTPADMQKMLQNHIDKSPDPDKKQQLQAIYDKHFGGGGQAAPAPEAPNVPPLNWLKEHWPTNSTIQNWSEPEYQEWAAQHQHHTDPDGGDTPSVQSSWMNDEFGDKAAYQPAPTLGAQPSVPTKEELLAAGIDVPWFDQTPETLQQNYTHVKENPDQWGPSTDWGKIVSYIDSKGGLGATPPAPGGFVKPTMEQLVAAGVDPSYAKGIAAQDDEKFKGNLQWAKDNPGKNGYWDKILKYVQGGDQQPKPPLDLKAWTKFGPNYQGWFNNVVKGKPPEEQQQILQNAVQAKGLDHPLGAAAQKALDEHFGAGPATPAAPPPWDPQAFAKEYINALGQAGGSSVAQGSATAEKAKGKVEQLINDYPDGEKTPLLKALHDKWFGQGIPSAPQQLGADDQDEISAIKDFQEPEEDEGVSAPAKSEPVNPEELAAFAAAKPATAEGWKNFANWWGKTQILPEQEQQLYSTWFPNKHPSPEAASAWFGQVYDHYSKPSIGDLGAQGMPAWAASSWALGAKAAAEWPVFSQWATKDAGIPKGLGIKQKLAIWNGLSTADKKEITENYAPAQSVDTQAVVGALQAAFPDSDWSKWSAMPQGTLKTNVEMLAKGGYAPAIPVFNQFFGGTLPMPKAVAKGTPAPKAAPTLKMIPPSKLPQWVKNKWGDDENGSIKYTEFKHFADSLGIESQSTYPSQTVYAWQGMPPYLQKQINALPTPPWHDQAGFQAWKDTQPTPATELAQIVPEADLPWALKPGNSYNNSSQAKELGKLIEAEPDPQQKQALLGIYHKYFSNGKTTLAQALTGIYPTQDWDKTLKSTTTDTTMKLLKKQLKAEKDPEKFVQLVDIWNKYFPHPTGSSYKTAPTGVKVVGEALKYAQPGQAVSADQLKKLKYWKEQLGGDTSQSLPGVYDTQGYDPGPYITSKTKEDSGYPAYHGWTPPGEGDDFKADPAMLGSTGPTYAAPAAEAKGKQYQKLVEVAEHHKADTHAGWVSKAEVATLKSEEFANWFSHASKTYKEVYQHNPGIALDDFKSFMGGGVPYGETPAQGPGSQYYDVSPFGMIPKSKAKMDLTKVYGPGYVPPPGQNKVDYNPQTFNPQRSDKVKFRRNQDTQETIPGVNWSPNYAPMPVYRIMPIDISAQPSLSNAPPGLSSKEQKSWLTAQQDRIKRIREIMWGTAAGKGEPNLFTDSPGQQWPKDAPPVPSSPDQWMDVLQWAKKNDLSAEQMYDLAEKAGATPGKHGQPPLAATPGTYDHPELAQLWLDYLENNAGGLGIHWTRNIGKGYEGIPSAGVGPAQMKGTKNNIPVMISGWWSGQGEDTAGRGGAYDPHAASEQEHTLLHGAPVYVHRLQIRSPDQDWHDLVDYGPVSQWPEGNTSTDPTEKPSLQTELGKLGVSAPKTVDLLKPGEKTDVVFRDLVTQNPDKKDLLAKLYQRFFVGRPDLPTKPHHRHAGVHPVQKAHEFAEDLNGVLWHQRQLAKEVLFGAPSPHWHQPVGEELEELESKIARLAAEQAPRRKRALVVVDPQNDFISGSLPVDGGEQAAQRLAGLVARAKDAGYDHVVTTQDWHVDPGTHWSATPDYKDSWPEHGKANSWGAQLHPAFSGLPVDEHFFKGHHSPGYSGFEGNSNSNEALHDWLTRNNVGDVDVAGIATDKCVYHTAKDAAHLGYHTRVLPHYSAAVTPEGGSSALQDLTDNHGVGVFDGPVAPAKGVSPIQEARPKTGGITRAADRYAIWQGGDPCR